MISLRAVIALSSMAGAGLMGSAALAIPISSVAPPVLHRSIELIGFVCDTSGRCHRTRARRVCDAQGRCRHHRSATRKAVPVHPTAPDEIPVESGANARGADVGSPTDSNPVYGAPEYGSSSYGDLSYGNPENGRFSLRQTCLSSSSL